MRTKLAQARTGLAALQMFSQRISRKLGPAGIGIFSGFSGFSFSTLDGLMFSDSTTLERYLIYQRTTATAIRPKKRIMKTLTARFAQPIIVPAAYRPVNTLDLSYHACQADTVGWFTLDQPTDAGVFVTLSQINTPYFDLVLTGPNGFQAAVLHAEGYSASQDSANLEKRMEPGQYWLLLTADQSPGLVTLYVKDR